MVVPICVVHAEVECKNCVDIHALHYPHILT